MVEPEREKWIIRSWENLGEHSGQGLQARVSPSFTEGKTHLVQRWRMMEGEVWVISVWRRSDILQVGKQQGKIYGNLYAFEKPLAWKQWLGSKLSCKGMQLNANCKKQQQPNNPSLGHACWNKGKIHLQNTSKHRINGSPRAPADNRFLRTSIFPTVWHDKEEKLIVDCLQKHNNLENVCKLREGLWGITWMILRGFFTLSDMRQEI